jgi:hypothetical protein
MTRLGFCAYVAVALLASLAIGEYVAAIDARRDEPPVYLYVVTSRGNWCEACIKLRPTLAHLEADGCPIVRRYVDEPGGQIAAKRHGIEAVPTVLLVVRRRVVGRVELVSNGPGNK